MKSNDQDLVDFIDESEEQDLERLAKAFQVHETQEKSRIEEILETAQKESELELKIQIAEDLALEDEIQKELDLAQESDEIEVFSTEPLEIQANCETLLFLSERPISAQKIQQLLYPNIGIGLIEEAFQKIHKRYQSKRHGFECVPVGNGWQFRTKETQVRIAKKLAKTQIQRLSRGAMETLAIIAYQQPVMKEEIDRIRGVDSSHFIRGLLTKKLVQISGRSDLPGKPMLYSTTDQFLEIFSIANLESLPSLAEIEKMIPESSVGTSQTQDQRLKLMKNLIAQMNTEKTPLQFNAEEDETFLKEIRERIKSIPTSTPTLDAEETPEELKNHDHGTLAENSSQNPGPLSP